MMAGEAFARLSSKYDYLAQYKSETITDLPLHLAINRRHAALVPELDKAIHALVTSGEVERELLAIDR